MGSSANLAELRSLHDRAGEGPRPDADIMICPPATLLAQAAVCLVRKRHPARRPGLPSADDHGAHTGDISAEMLADAGAKRRDRRPFGAAHRPRRDRRRRQRQGPGGPSGRADSHHLHWRDRAREAGRRDPRRREAPARRLASAVRTAANTVIAYEPVWAIGTGWTPTPQDVAAVHGIHPRPARRRAGRGRNAIRILYGGSVKPSNASELLSVPSRRCAGRRSKP